MKRWRRSEADRAFSRAGDGPVFLFLDFDGTLVSIVKRPDAVRLLPPTRRILVRLKRLCRVVVVSGRSLDDLKRHFRVPGIDRVGNHGLEMGEVGVRPSPPLRAALRQARCMPKVLRALRSALSGCRGSFVEDKRLTISAHFRNVPASGRRAFEEAIQGCRERCQKYPVIWRRGKKVWEVRPAGNWGKGDAVKLMRQKFGRGFSVVMGDDDTDEDMFRAVGPSGLSVRVGLKPRSYAAYFLPSPRFTPSFLNALLDRLSRRLKKGQAAG